MPVTNEQVYNEIRSLRTEVAQIASLTEQAKEVIRIVKGYDGQESLLVRIDRIQNACAQHTHVRATDEVRALLYGDDDHPGLVHDIEELKKWRAALDRWGWFLATTAIVSVLNLTITVLFYLYGVR